RRRARRGLPGIRRIRRAWLAARRRIGRRRRVQQGSGGNVMRYATLLVAFAALISASRDAAAQYAPSCVVSTSGGVIRGIMVDDTGYGVADAHVHAGRCRTTTDELGRFILHGVWPRGVVVHGHTLEFATRVSRLALHEGDTAS